MSAEKVDFTQVKETLLLTLYARAQESQSANPILSDPASVAAMQKIDYDFGKIKMRPTDRISIAMRTRLFDEWTSDFVARTPKATVLYLGCGMDSRVYRVDPPGSVRWFDVDFPDVIELRRNVFPERGSYTMIGASVLEPGWLDQVPGDQPAMIIAEGLLMYLGQEEVPALLKRLFKHFPSGEIIFDCISTAGVRMQKMNKNLAATGATLGWGLDDPHEVEAWGPTVKIKTEMTAVDPSLPGIEKLPASTRFVLKVMKAIPAMRGLARIMRYEF